MDQDEMIRLCKQHTLYTWAASGGVNPLPVARAEGIYLYGPDGYVRADSAAYGGVRDMARRYGLLE